MVSYEKGIRQELSGKYRVSGALFPININEFIDDRFIPQNLNKQ